MYASVEQLKNRLKGLYDQLYLDGETANDSLAEDDLTAVSAEIDGALAERYAVPVVTESVQPLLRSWTLTLVEELAWCRGDAVKVPESVEKRCTEVRKLLSLYADGKRKLAAVAELNTGAAAALVYGPDPVMTRDDLAGW